mmetsp:Transcript_12906/g.36176  ORF Transcript_12906/g.36176 Transcript_12906/m.36176 type:complete len:262 (+) Transcript_12906:1424-2209(+)
MGALQDAVPGIVFDQPASVLCPLAPQQEHDVLLLRRDRLYDLLGECLPAPLAVGPRGVCSHGEHGIEQQDALGGPFLEVPVRRGHCPAVGFQLLVDVPKTHRNLNPVGHGEAQSHGLPDVVVRVLTQDHYLHLAWGAGVERAEDVPRLREYLDLSLPLRVYETLQRQKVFTRELILESVHPACLQQELLQLGLLPLLPSPQDTLPNLPRFREHQRHRAVDLRAVRLLRLITRALAFLLPIRRILHLPLLRGGPEEVLEPSL